MFANDVEERSVRKSLFVIADGGGCIDARQNCRLPGSTLRPAFNAKPRVSFDQDPIERYTGSFVLKDREWIRIWQSVKRIMWAAGSDTEPIDEE